MPLGPAVARAPRLPPWRTKRPRGATGEAVIHDDWLRVVNERGEIIQSGEKWWIIDEPVAKKTTEMVDYSEIIVVNNIGSIVENDS